MRDQDTVSAPNRTKVIKYYQEDEMQRGNPATHIARMKYFISPARDLNIVSALEGTSVLPYAYAPRWPRRIPPSPPFWTGPGVQGVPLQGADTGIAQWGLMP